MLQKWDKKVWDLYFPIIYTNHLGALSLTLVFIPYIFAAILAYVHFIAFFCLIIVNIFIQDAEEGKGNRTTVSRILWMSKLFINIFLVMCIANVLQLINGLTGVPKVLE